LLETLFFLIKPSINFLVNFLLFRSLKLVISVVIKNISVLAIKMTQRRHREGDMTIYCVGGGDLFVQEGEGVWRESPT
jgi:hypothetical protein